LVLALPLTVVIPTYNEVENLPVMVSTLFALPLRDLQILIVDDNSPDGTGQLAEELGAANGGRVSVLHRSSKQGLGTAYIQGFQMALLQGASAVVQMDADFSHPPDKLVEMAQGLESCDVVLGSRYVPGGSLDERWSIWRKMLSGWGNFYSRVILRIPVQDITGGFRAWRREALLKMPLDRVQSNGYAFQVEMVYIAYRLGLRIEEIPIYFQDRTVGSSKMSFQIQREAAIRVWQLLYQYRDLKPTK
jgi:dolichol-phosphate mannosyltransferase